MTRNSPSLEREINECFLEMHPEDAAELKVLDGDWVVIASRRGSVSTRVKLTDGARRKTVFMPFHFVESRANVLTNPAFDPIAKIPEYKVCAVKIQKMDPSDKHFASSVSPH
jgi:predicted molibdopterin-dependent oxidoreductase YjgC